jgi:transcriptional regulator with XRE-family HTH domain
MSTPWERLREERLRLGLSQEAFGAHGGVRKQAQIKYEKGERKPDAAYLEGIAAAGANVDYILTGTPAAVRGSLNDIKTTGDILKMLSLPEDQVGEYQEKIFGLLGRARKTDEDEGELLEHYRRCSTDDRAQIKGLAKRLAPAVTKKGVQK